MGCRRDYTLCKLEAYDSAWPATRSSSEFRSHFKLDLLPRTSFSAAKPVIIRFQIYFGMFSNGCRGMFLAAPGVAGSHEVVREVGIG